MRFARYGDERLASAVHRGHPEAFAELYRRHHQALYRYCRSLLRDEDDAQDALQSAMTSAFRALRKEERDLAVRPWLFRIVHNEAMSLLRVRGRVVSVEDGEDGLGAAPPASEPEVAFERRERLNALVLDLQALPTRQRAALLMRELSGLSIEEIAAALSTTPGAAKQALFEARQALNELADGRSMDCEAVTQVLLEGDGRVLRSRRIRSHLRACPQCAQLHESIATRTADLHALTPVLPGAIAAKLLLDALRHAGVDPVSSAAAASSLSTASTGSVSAGSSSTVGIAAHLGGSLAGKLALGAAALTIAAGGGAGIAISNSGHAASEGRHGHRSAPRRAAKRAETTSERTAHSSRAAQISPHARGSRDGSTFVQSERRHADSGPGVRSPAAPAIARGGRPALSEAGASPREHIRSGRALRALGQARGTRPGMQERSAGHRAAGTGAGGAGRERPHPHSAVPHEAHKAHLRRPVSAPGKRQHGRTRPGRSPGSPERPASPARSTTESHGRRNDAPAPEAPVSSPVGELGRESAQHALARPESSRSSR